MKVELSLHLFLTRSDNIIMDSSYNWKIKCSPVGKLIKKSGRVNTSSSSMATGSLPV